jgi:PTS system cellobiose-specific IIB component
MTIVKLFCSAGMSTSLFAMKMQQEADARGLDYKFSAYGLAELDQEAPTADIILIGPQERYVVDDVKKEFPDKPVSVIPMRMYGMMNGVEGMDFVLQLEAA